MVERIGIRQVGVPARKEHVHERVWYRSRLSGTVAELRATDGARSRVGGQRGEVLEDVQRSMWEDDSTCGGTVVRGTATVGRARREFVVKMCVTGRGYGAIGTVPRLVQLTLELS